MSVDEIEEYIKPINDLCELIKPQWVSEEQKLRLDREKLEADRKQRC